MSKTVCFAKYGKFIQGALFLSMLLAVTPAPAEDDWGPFAGPWERYDGNPLLPNNYPSEADRGNFKRLDGGMSHGADSIIEQDGKLWMFLYDHKSKGTKLAVSEDGLEWEYVHEKPVIKADKAWEGNYAAIKATEVINNQVYLYYTGNVGIEEQMGVVRNTDADLMTTDWEKHPDNPVFTNEDVSGDAEQVIPSSVVEDKGSYYVFFADTDMSAPNRSTINVGISKDGTDFKLLAEDIVAPGDEGSWESRGVRQAAVRKIDDWWYMIYVGIPRGYVHQAFGLARARKPEGPWEKYPGNPIFTPEGTDWKDWELFLQHPCPVKVNGEWRLYYAGCNGYHYWGHISVATRRESK